MGALRFLTRDGLELEGELRAADGRPRGTAVLCHAHPRHGGSKDHPILWAIRNDLASKRGLTVLAFNFRGVMGSEGTYGGGTSELTDVAAAVDRVRGENGGTTVLAGWSFGAWVALCHALTDHRIGAAVLLGMPLAAMVSPRRPMPSLGELEELSIPVLLVCGDRDPYAPPDRTVNLAGWIPRAEHRVVAGTDHFFARREREVAELVGEWVERVVSAQT
jgi:alpha/beta superfamily hydrolase